LKVGLGGAATTSAHACCERELWGREKERERKREREREINGWIGRPKWRAACFDTISYFKRKKYSYYCLLYPLNISWVCKYQNVNIPLSISMFLLISLSLSLPIFFLLPGLFFMPPANKSLYMKKINPPPLSPDVSVCLSLFLSGGMNLPLTNASNYYKTTMEGETFIPRGLGRQLKRKERERDSERGRMGETDTKK
jgi:hypothetical protein